METNKVDNTKDSWLHAASIKSTVWNKLGVYPSPFHISTSSRLTLTGAFHGGYVAACSTAFRSATEENDSGGYVDVPCPSKVKQHSSTADWLKFWWRHQISYDGTHTEQTFNFEVKLCSNSQAIETCYNCQPKLLHRLRKGGFL